MISNKQAKESVERLLADRGKRPEGRRHLAEIAADRVMLSEWAIQELSRREAEQAERARPITREWLASVGFLRNDSGYWTCNSGGVNVSVAVLDGIDRCQIVVSGSAVATEKETRGQLLDLLAALKGGAS